MLGGIQSMILCHKRSQFDLEHQLMLVMLDAPQEQDVEIETPDAILEPRAHVEVPRSRPQRER